MINFSPVKFFNLSYLFDLQPAIYPSTINLMVGFFGLILIAGMVIKIYNKINKLEKIKAKLLEKYANLLLTLGFLGLALTWFRYERINLLSARFWLLLWLMLTIIWLYKILNYQFKTLPKIKKDSENKKLLQKYLPKKK